MDASYNQVISSLLLREAIVNLAPKEQLLVRTVNRDWEDEAFYAIRKRQNHLIRLARCEEVKRFLEQFQGNEVQIGARLINMTRVVLSVGTICPTLLANFGAQFGGNIRCLSLETLGLTTPNFYAHCMSLLHCLPNVRELTISPYSVNTESPSDFPSEQNSAADFGRLENLKYLSMTFSIGHARLFHEIVNKIRAGTLSKLYLIDHEGQNDTPLQLERLASLQILSLKLAIRTQNLGFLRQLSNTSFQASRVTIIFGLQESFSLTLEFKLLLCQFVRNLVNQSKVLNIVNFSQSGLEITFPVSLPGINSLSFRGNIAVITETEFPDLLELTENCPEFPLSSQLVFTNLRKFVSGTEGYFPERDEDVAILESKLLNDRFPNLSVLHIFVGPYTEEILDSVFSVLLALTELRVVFDTRNRTGYNPLVESYPTLWRSITGTDHTQLNSFIPKLLARSIDSTRTEIFKTSLTSLKNIKILEFIDCPGSAYFGVVFLTAVKNLGELKKLLMTPKCTISLYTEACLELLQAAHDVVMITN